tara:strand:+ start:1757 stop:1942 length:186 start_codon:yes stop_codon:yes gene_type:complete
MKKSKKSPLLKKLKRHNNITKDYELTKSKHLERLATKMLDEQDKIEKLRDKKINDDFLDLF